MVKVEIWNKSGIEGQPAYKIIHADTIWDVFRHIDEEYGRIRNANVNGYFWGVAFIDGMEVRFREVI